MPILFTPIVAQTATATLSGTVQDENSAVIPGVQVVVKNYATSLERTATTNESGSFTVPLLPPGTYTITATRDGFTPIKVTEVVLNVGDQKSLSFQMKVGSVDAAVQVTPETSLVRTDSSVSTTVDRNFVGNLPLNGRSFQSLILLTPGIVGTVSDGFHPGEFSVNGQRQNANYFTVDGVSANTGVSTSQDGPAFSQQAGGSIPGTTALGTTASLVSVDALEEFKIQTSSYSAEFGRQPGAQVQLVTRAGGNEYHGTGFEYLRNDALDARDWFANARRLPKAPLRQNQFGGTFSGPVVLPRFGEGAKPYWSGKNRTFFFFSYEGQRLRIPVLNVAQTVPSLRLRQAAAPSLQPFLNAFPMPTGPETIVGRNPFRPIDPDPNSPTYNPPVPSGAAPFVESYSSPSSVDAYSIRMDHTVNGRLTLFGRYGDTPSSSLTRFQNQLSGNVQRERTLTLGSTLSVTSRVTNEFRFNYTTNRGQYTGSLDDFGGAVPVTVSQLTSGYSGPGAKFGVFTISYGRASFGLRLGDGVDNRSRQMNIVDNLSWVKGSHQLKFGFDWRQLNPTYGPYAYWQQLSFQSEASVINGTVNQAFFVANKGARPIYNNYSAYAQDTWKLSPRLTLDLGLRWEMNPAPYDATGLRPVVLTGINGTDVSNVTIAPPSAPYYKTFKMAFAPRLGVAYQLNQTSGRETVLRGGFGVYYDLGSGWASSLFDRYPFQSFASFNNVPFPLSTTIAHPPPFLPVPTQITQQLAGQAFVALDPNLQLPYTLEWNVALEQSLGKQQTVTLSYVASAASRLITRQLMNQGSNLTDDSTRPNPNLGDILYITNGPTSDYQSLQAQYQRRLSHGLQAVVNYTWSHAIDTVSNEVDYGQLTRGNADFDVRHNFSAAVTYNLPKLRGAAPWFVKAIASGWSVDTIFYARTGLPLDLFAGDLFLGNGIDIQGRPDVVPGLPFWINDPTMPGGRRLNRAAFVSPPVVDVCAPFGCLSPARQGTLGRNVIRLPGIYQLNTAVRRQFRLGERLNLQLKAEAFNVLNHPLFGSYVNNLLNGDLIGTPTGMLSSTMGGLNSLYQIGGPRSMQLSVRLAF